MEELNLALAELIEKATAGVDASVGFLQAELPDVVYQLLLWNGAYSLFMCLLGMVILSVGVTIDVKLSKKAWDRREDDDDIFWFGCVCVGSLARAVIYFPAIYSVNLTWLQIWIAPKVWLLEYAANLVK